MKIINQQRRKDMKKFIILLALMLSSVAAMAEEKNDTVIITLQNGTEVRYTTDEFDRVQIIYNLKYGVKVYLKNGKSKDYLATKGGPIPPRWRGGDQPQPQPLPCETSGVSPSCRRLYNESTCYQVDCRLWHHIQSGVEL